MKQIIAILQSHRLEKVETSLQQLSHLPGFTLFPAHGHPRGHGAHHAFSGDEWNPDMHERLVLMMFCPDEMVTEAVEAIRTAAYTGNPGDGLIAVSDIQDIVRIRTGERGDAAL